MQTNGTYQQQNTGAGTIYLIYSRWNEHGDVIFVSLMQTLNNHYCLYMEEDIYFTIFEDTITKVVLKSNALTLVNEWYC